jgi:hypothetical protein
MARAEVSATRARFPRASRRRFYPAALLPGLVWLLCAAEGGPWVTYRGEGFSVRFPSTPRVASDEMETPAGPQRVLVVSSLQAHESYAVTCTFYARALVERAGAERLLAAALERFLEETEGALIRRQRIEVLGHPGQEVAFLSPDSQRITFTRLFFAGDRLFSLVGDLPRSTDADRQVEQFFGSFMLEPDAERTGTGG